MSDDCCLAALSPSTPRAYGATLRASGVDRSARPSKEGYHAMNADTRLALFNRTYDVLNKGNCPIEKCREKNSTKKHLTCGASYKPPALPGDIYCCFRGLGAWLEPSSRDASTSRLTFSRISFESAGAACATDRDRTSAPSISQCKLIARSRNVLRSPATAKDPLSAISPARIVI